MPKMSEPGQQIKVWLPDHILDALRQDAKDGGERKVQPVIRYILGQHYRDQLVEMSESQMLERASP